MAGIQISGKQEIEIESATRDQHQQVAKLMTEQLIEDIHIDTVLDPPKNLTKIRQQQAFLSAEQHLNTATEDLSKQWEISVAQAALILKATTQKLVKSEIMPLSRRY